MPGLAYRVFGYLGLVLLVFGLGFVYGRSVANRVCEAGKAELVQAAAAAAQAGLEEARRVESMWREAFDANARRLNDEKARIADALDIALHSLRSRPARDPAGAMPGDAGHRCTGATGAELSREDSEFLVREAARADTVRAGLQECYAAIDAVRKK